MSTKDSKNKGYSADDITVLEGLEAVRKRPGMYIGTTGVDGLHHLVHEVFDNSRDEAMAGHADEIEVILLENDVVRVSDNGRGIPVDVHKKTKVSALETIMTTLHAGGKFGGEGYKVSGGLHGVGISVVNALSTNVKAIVHRDGKIYSQSYKLGKPEGKIKEEGKSKQNGTTIYFKADEGIFNTTNFNYDRIGSYLRDQAYLVKGLRIRLIDGRNNKVDVNDNELFIWKKNRHLKSITFSFDGGVKSFVSYSNRLSKTIHNNIFYTESKVGDIEVEVALQYIDDISNRILAFANNIINPEGGTHVTGFKTALTRSINTYSKEKKMVKDEVFSGDDVLEGITAIILIRAPEIQFEGQTKSKLGTVEARGAVDKVFFDGFSRFLEENPDDAKSIIGKATLAARARKAAKAAKDSVLKKGLLDNTLPGKLGSCQTKNPEEAEIFIVEGESAGGTAKQGRDRKFQAVLPLRGKILNAERTRLDRLLSNEEVKALTIALGTAIGDTFNIEKLRYHKVIIATDADVDGAHIRTLLLTLFYRYFKGLIDGGYVYIAQPPLYKIKKGKKIDYVYSDAERDKILGKGYNEGENTGGAEVQRYKGLGEMNHEELRETTMSPENRILKQVRVGDAIEANKTFDVLMGSQVEPRKNFIQANAKSANIDL